MTYHELRFWSPTLGCNAVRLSCFDAHGGEHFAIVSMDGSGRRNREMRQAALTSIAEHIAAGEDPGQVQVRDPMEGRAHA